MAVLKSAVKALDPAPDKKKELTLLLSLLTELCEQKVTEFEKGIETDLRTAGTVENKTIPITEILSRHKEYRAYISQDSGKIATEVSGAIKKFIAGTADSIIDGVASLVTTGIEAIIGSGEASQQEMSSYFVIVQSYGLLRFDVRIWVRHIEANGITKEIERAMAIVAFKSSVDVRSISLNTFLIAYQDQLAKIGISESEWEKYLQTAESIFERLRNDTQPAPQSPMLVGSTKSIGPAQLCGSLWDEAGNRLDE